MARRRLFLNTPRRGIKLLPLAKRGIETIKEYSTLKSQGMTNDQILKYYVMKHGPMAATKLFEAVDSRASSSSFNQKPRGPNRSKNPTGIQRIGLGMTASSFELKGKSSLMKSNDGAELSRDTSMFISAGSFIATNYGQQYVGYPANYLSKDTIKSRLDVLVPSNTLDSQRVQVQYYKCVNQLHNMDRVSARVTILDCIPLKDMKQTDENEAPGNAPDNNPYDTWRNAWYKVTGVTTSKIDTQVDGNPSSFSYFNTRWKIVNRTEVYLAPGYTHEHTFKITGSYPFHESRLSTLDTFGFLKGLTYYPLFVIKSGPIRDSSDMSVTLGSCDIIYTQSHRLSLAAQQAGVRTYANTSTFDTAITGLQNVASATEQGQIIGGDSTNTDVQTDAEN